MYITPAILLKVVFFFQGKKYSVALDAFNEMYETDIRSLRPFQEKALDILLSGNDCICSLPTGYGKSLIYQLLPFINQNRLVIVIAPLNAIMTQ